MLRFVLTVLLAIAGIYLVFSSFFDLFFSLINPYIAGAFVGEVSKLAFGVVLLGAAYVLVR